jgi:hypothetical protein
VLDMQRIDPQHLAWTLENLADGKVVNQISVPEHEAKLAKLALDRMLAIPDREPAVTSRGMTAAPRAKDTVRKLHVCTFNIHKGFSQFKARMMIHELRKRLHGLEPRHRLPAGSAGAARTACRNGTRTGPVKGSTTSWPKTSGRTPPTAAT